MKEKELFEGLIKSRTEQVEKPIAVSFDAILAEERKS
jgi:hypothetical protein